MSINLHASRFNPILNVAPPILIHPIWILIRDYLAVFLEVVLNHQRLHAKPDLGPLLTVLLFHCCYEIYLVLLLLQPLLALLSLKLDVIHLHNLILHLRYVSLVAWLWVISLWLDVMPVSNHSLTPSGLFVIVATNLWAAWLESVGVSNV